MALFAIPGGSKNGRKTRFLTIFDDFGRFRGSPQEMPEMPEIPGNTKKQTSIKLRFFTI